MTATTDRRDAILRAVAFTGERLLQPGDLDAHIDAALHELGTATGVDRVYVFRVDGEGLEALASQTHEWARPGVEPQIDNPDLQDLPFAAVGFGRWLEVLAAGGAIDGAVQDFPASEHELLASQDIRALAVVPVTVDGAWWGFIGFDLTSDERPFQPTEVAALRTAAGIIGAAIGQRAAWRRLDEHRAELAEALDSEREAVSRLEELDRMKSTFLDAVSHELRTPLTAVLGLASMLRDDGVAPDIRTRALERLDRNADRLDDLLTRLLDLNRLTAAAEHVAPEDVDVAELLDDVVADHPVGDERQVTLDAAGTARVDPGVLTRVTNHLLDNVRVHTEADHRVWVTATVTEDGLLVVVADDGPGVPADLREQVFESFTHGEMRRPHAPGTGVGLTLVAGLARLHGGRAWCDERPGGGAAFHVLLAPDLTGD